MLTKLYCLPVRNGIAAVGHIFLELALWPQHKNTILIFENHFYLVKCCRGIKQTDIVKLNSKASMDFVLASLEVSVVHRIIFYCEVLQIKFNYQWVIYPLLPPTRS